jgi:hypothetical protein
MPSIKTSIIIDAPPSTVRAAFLDFSSYPSWNKFIASVEPPTPNPTPGTRLRITLVGAENPMELVVKENTTKTFSWAGNIGPPLIFKGHHFMKFEPYGEMGANEETLQCKLLSYEKFSGILAWFFLLFVREWTEQGYIAMNKSLKDKAETMARGT